MIGTEYEPAKVRAAKKNFIEAGLEAFIELREADRRETLQRFDGVVDFMLVDIWTPMPAPAVELVAPHLRLGAVVVCGNTGSER